MQPVERQRVRVVSYGSSSPKEPKLNLVMVRSEFDSIHHLVDYCARMLKHPKFSNKEPYFILFPELPFSAGYFPKRREVKGELARLKGLAAGHGGNVAFGLSINESRPLPKHVDEPKGFLKRLAFWKSPLGQRARPHSNTGYVVQATGHKAYPKIEYAISDGLSSAMYSNADLLGNDSWSSTRYSKADLLGNKAKNRNYKAQWNKRATRFRKLMGKAFPAVSFGQTGHKVEYRVCLDSLFPAQEAGSVLAVSAQGLNSSNVEKLARHYRVIVVNDSMHHEGSHKDFGRRVIAGKGINVNVDDRDADLGPLTPLLDREKIRLHVVG